MPLGALRFFAAGEGEVVSMAFGSGSSKGSGLALALFALASVAGTCASLYAIVVAYLAGSSAQAYIDDCPAADPLSLARASMSELSSSVASSGDGVISVDDSAVVVADANPPAADASGAGEAS